jgi:tRNA 2-thiouridine synthesizing protein A
VREINCLGMRCPLPIVAVGKELANIDAGESLLLLSDDPATEIDLRAWARMTGNAVLASGLYKFLVTKSEVH